MTEIAYFIYESNSPIETADKYFLQLKGHVEFDGDDDEKLRIIINSSSITFFKSLSLFEAFGLLENSEGMLSKNYYKSVIDACSGNKIQIKKFKLTTIDAVQTTEENNQVNLQINPDLERKKKKGMLGKLFGRK